MTDPAKFVTCVDCGTPLIGDILRCGACNEQLDRALAPSAQADGDGAPGVLARWVVVVQVIAIGTLGLILAARGCAS